MMSYECDSSQEGRSAFLWAHVAKSIIGKIMADV